MPLDSERTYRALRNAIYRGDYSPGARLVERDLARRLKTSRIPIRESLIRLASDGLVRRVPSSATFVEDLPAQDVLEICSMRLALEPLATQLTATRSTDTLVRSLKRLCKEMTAATKCRDLRRLDAIDLDFHRMIVESSQHKRLIRAYDSSHIAILTSRPGYLQLQVEPAESTANDHQSIIEAIVAGDPISAWQTAYNHVNRSLLKMEAILGISLGEKPTSPVVRRSQPKARRI